MTDAIVKKAVEHARMRMQQGRPVFAVLDESERDVFRARYAEVTDLSWLDRPPTLVAANRVYFYEVPPPAPGP